VTRDLLPIWTSVADQQRHQHEREPADKKGASCVRYRCRVVSGRLQALRCAGRGGLTLQLLLVRQSRAGQSQQNKQALR